MAATIKLTSSTHSARLRGSALTLKCKCKSGSDHGINDQGQTSSQPDPFEFEACLEEDSSRKQCICYMGCIVDYLPTGYSIGRADVEIAHIRDDDLEDLHWDYMRGRNSGLYDDITIEVSSTT